MLPPKKRKTYESSSDAGATYIAIPKQVKSYVNRAIRKATELKYIDFDINGTASTTGTYQVKLNTIGVGTSYNQRIGDSVKLRRIEWDLQVKRVTILMLLALSWGLPQCYLSPSSTWCTYRWHQPRLWPLPSRQEELCQIHSCWWIYWNSDHWDPIHQRSSKNETSPAIQRGLSDFVELEYLHPVPQWLCFNSPS